MWRRVAVDLTALDKFVIFFNALVNSKVKNIRNRRPAKTILFAHMAVLAMLGLIVVAPF